MVAIDGRSYVPMKTVAFSCSVFEFVCYLQGGCSGRIRDLVEMTPAQLSALYNRQVWS